MTILLIAVVAIVIIAVSVQINNSTHSYDTSYDLVTKEVIQLLELLQAFIKCGPDSCFGSVQIIPIDLSGNLYGYTTEGKKNAEKIEIDVLIMDDDVNIFRSVLDFRANQAGTDKFYKLKTRDNLQWYSAVTTYRFNGKYKKFMPYLNNAVVKRFPELDIRFDGSMIIIKHM